MVVDAKRLPGWDWENGSFFPVPFNALNIFFRLWCRWRRANRPAQATRAASAAGDAAKPSPVLREVQEKWWREYEAARKEEAEAKEAEAKEAEEGGVAAAVQRAVEKELAPLRRQIEELHSKLVLA